MTESQTHAPPKHRILNVQTIMLHSKADLQNKPSTAHTDSLQVSGQVC